MSESCLFTLHAWSTAQESNTQIEDCLRFLANLWHVWCRPIGHLDKINGSNEKLEGFHGGHNHRSKHIKTGQSVYLSSFFIYKRLLLWNGNLNCYALQLFTFFEEITQTYIIFHIIMLILLIKGQNFQNMKWWMLQWGMARKDIIST